MKNSKINSVLRVFLFVLLVTSCGTPSPEKEEVHDVHDDHDANGEVSLTQQQRDAIDLELVEIEKQNLNVGIKVTGSLDLMPQARADVSPIMGGIVKNIMVIEGDQVKKGQVLATIMHPDFIQLQQDYITSLNDLEFLESDYKRKKKMYDENVGSGRDFQKISAEYKNKKSNVEALKMKLKMLGLNTSQIEKGKIYPSVSIVSPINGAISSIDANIGAYIAPMFNLFEIVNNDELHADFRVYESDINRVSIGQKIYFTTNSIPGQEFEGELHAMSPVIEDNPKALHVHAHITNDKKNLIPGMYIQGRVIAENIETDVLPASAFVLEDEKTFIFARTMDESKVNETWTFLKIEVITGAKANGFMEVKLLSPLPKDAKIVGKGAYFLLSEITKEEAVHEH